VASESERAVNALMAGESINGSTCQITGANAV
jgi:hypothetical protein